MLQVGLKECKTCLFAIFPYLLSTNWYFLDTPYYWAGRGWWDGTSNWILTHENTLCQNIYFLSWPETFNGVWHFWPSTKHGQWKKILRLQILFKIHLYNNLRVCLDWLTGVEKDKDINEVLTKLVVAELPQDWGSQNHSCLRSI